MEKRIVLASLILGLSISISILVAAFIIRDEIRGDHLVTLRQPVAIQLVQSSVTVVGDPGGHNPLPVEVRK
jgi:hypothetical protein